MKRIFGYARVSSIGQNEERQIAALKNAGVDKKSIFIDKTSGKTFDRPGYKRLIKELKQGDVLYIKSIDRLGRDYNEIIYQWRLLTKEKKVSIVVLDLPLLNTEICDDVTGTLISDIVLELFSYVAQMEREFIKQRQAEGIAIAKEKGIKFGRRPKEIPNAFFEEFSYWEAGLRSANRAAKSLKVSTNTFLKWARAIQ